MYPIEALWEKVVVCTKGYTSDEYRIHKMIRYYGPEKYVEKVVGGGARQDTVSLLRKGTINLIKTSFKMRMICMRVMVR